MHSTDEIRSILDPMLLVTKLCSFPHRGAGTAEEKQAADLLTRELESLGARVEQQPFRTPKTFIWMACWMIAGIVLGLGLLPWAPWPAWVLVVACAWMLILYFDWRRSPVTRLPPQTRSQNVIARFPAPEPGKQKLILMAHYDTAPISLLYRPALVTGLRRGILINMALIFVSALVASAGVAGLAIPVLLRGLLMGYFVLQGVLTLWDYLHYGYTNGASDNATGTAAAIATCARLMRDRLPGWDVEVVLTGAEEVIMEGAKVYYHAYKAKLDPRSSFVLNFDSLGGGDLKVITRTGSLTPVLYENPLVQAALDTAAQDSRFRAVQPGEWHTGDFDSVWFARSPIPSLTLCAIDEAGKIPHLHRPSDTFEHVNPEKVRFAVNFAEAVLRRLAADQATAAV